MFPRQIFELYKQLRKKVGNLAREESLRVIWAYTQYLQVPDFKIPPDIEVDRRFYERDVQRAWIPDDYMTQMPYSVWPIDDFELGLQIMNESSIAAVMDGKLLSAEKQDWEWRPYLSSSFKEPRKELFEDDYRKLFSDFHPA